MPNKSYVLLNFVLIDTVAWRCTGSTLCYAMLWSDLCSHWREFFS